jgi:hypothetical protein
MVSEKNKPLQKNLNIIIAQIAKMAKITRTLMNITKYETKSYLSKTIIDIEKASQKQDG